jgi:hypothetical protein
MQKVGQGLLFTFFFDGKLHCPTRFFKPVDPHELPFFQRSKGIFKFGEGEWFAALLNKVALGVKKLADLRIVHIQGSGKANRNDNQPTK